MPTSDDGFDLNMKWHFPEARRYIFTFCALFVVLSVIYGNSLQGEWHFDDHYNITENVNIHLKDLSWEQIKNTFHIRGVIRRPVSYFSFALNYYAGGLDTFGYHLVNLMIHYITSVFLFLLIYNTLKLPLLKERYEKSAYAIAILSSFLWAINPVQVTAVSIIVQRMASMVGMFYLISMYCYLKGRTGEKTWKGILFFIFSLLAALLAFGTKQNAAMLPVSIFLYDLFLIQGISKETIGRNAKLFILPLLILLFLGAYFTDLSSILGGYASRPFTLTERLLTEPRIVVFYLSLLFYPLSSRLALIHDIDISTSLFHPFTTLPAILLILATVGLACFVSKRRPLIAFSIIFFFLNHIIESSFIPLELIYEHRNYIPSMFLFVPIGILLIHVLDYFSYRKSLQIVVALGMVILLMGVCLTVHMRNETLKYNYTMWLDNIQKYPALSRVHSNLGQVYLSHGYRQEALKEFNAALNLRRYLTQSDEVILYYNLGQVYRGERRDDIALGHYRRALLIIPEYSPALAGIAVIKLKEGKTEEALGYIDRAHRVNRDNIEFRELKSFILLKLDRHEDALELSEEIVRTNDKRTIPYAIIAEVFRRRGEYDKSIHYWKTYLKRVPDSVEAKLALVGLYHSTGNQDLVSEMVWELVSLMGDQNVEEYIHENARKKVGISVYQIEEKRITSIIKDIIGNQIRSMDKK